MPLQSPNPQLTLNLHPAPAWRSPSIEPKYALSTRKGPELCLAEGRGHLSNSWTETATGQSPGEQDQEQSLPECLFSKGSFPESRHTSAGERGDFPKGSLRVRLGCLAPGVGMEELGIPKGKEGGNGDKKLQTRAASALCFAGEAGRMQSQWEFCLHKGTAGLSPVAGVLSLMTTLHFS